MARAKAPTAPAVVEFDMSEFLNGLREHLDGINSLLESAVEGVQLTDPDGQGAATGELTPVSAKELQENDWLFLQAEDQDGNLQEAYAMVEGAPGRGFVNLAYTQEALDAGWENGRHTDQDLVNFSAQLYVEEQQEVEPPPPPAPKQQRAARTPAKAAPAKAAPARTAPARTVPVAPRGPRR